MANVLISIGSNCQQAVHVRWAAERLSQLLHTVTLSRRLWTPDSHGSGLWYMNQLAAGITDYPLPELEQALKAMERATGRKPGQVTLDLDILSYDSQRLHLSDWPKPYIQQLLTDIQQLPT